MQQNTKQSTRATAKCRRVSRYFTQINNIPSRLLEPTSAGTQRGKHESLGYEVVGQWERDRIWVALHLANQLAAYRGIATYCRATVSGFKGILNLNVSTNKWPIDKESFEDRHTQLSNSGASNKKIMDFYWSKRRGVTFKIKIIFIHNNIHDHTNSGQSGL